MSPLLDCHHQLPRSTPNCVHSTRPMSVQEWRKAVWLESYAHPKSFCLDSENDVPRGRSAAELDMASVSPALCPSHEALSRNTSQSLARRLSTKPVVKRASVRVAPLIDLNQPRDASGRPVLADEDDHRQRDRTRLSISRHTNHSTTPLLSSGPLPSTKANDDQLEARHRAAMRRLQAEAVDQIEHAEMLRQRRMTSSHHHSCNTTPSKLARSTLLSNSSLAPVQKRYRPTGPDIDQPPFNSTDAPSPRRSRPLVASLVHKGSAKVVGVVRSLNNFRRKPIKSPGRGGRIEDNSSQSCSLSLTPGVFRRFSTLGFRHSSPHRS